MLTSHPPRRFLTTGTGRLGLAALLAAGALVGGPAFSGLPVTVAAQQSAGSSRSGVVSPLHPATLPHATGTVPDGWGGWPGEPTADALGQPTVVSRCYSNLGSASAPLPLQAWVGTSLSGEQSFPAPTKRASHLPTRTWRSAGNGWSRPPTSPSHPSAQRCRLPRSARRLLPAARPGVAELRPVQPDWLRRGQPQQLRRIKRVGAQRSPSRLRPWGGSVLPLILRHHHPERRHLLPAGYPVGATCSRVYLFHTENGDPTGQWEGYFFNSYYADTITDQPMVGFSGDKIGVSWDEFNVANGLWVGDDYFVLSKATFLANAPNSDRHRPPVHPARCTLHKLLQPVPGAQPLWRLDL